MKRLGLAKTILGSARPYNARRILLSTRYTSNLNIQPSIYARCASTESTANNNNVGATVTEHDKLKSRPSINLPKGEYLLPHPIWADEYIDAVRITHVKPKRLRDYLALFSVRLMRFNFDWMTGYLFLRHPGEKAFFTRCVFLETVAGIPGSIGALIRHLASLRRMKRDHGWIHTLLEEAENERMHLLTFLQLRHPGLLMRNMVFLAQGIFFNFFFLSYLISPPFCHRFVGYLEEEAVKTYTKCLQEIDNGPKLGHWKTQPPPLIAKKYWKMADDSTMRDMIAVIRADEAHHRDVNHAFSDHPDLPNRFQPGH